MKKSDLKSIIKEELINVLEEIRLAEAFADPNIRKVSKLGGIDTNKYTNFFRSFARTHDIAWDKLPTGTLNKTSNTNDPMIKTGLAFWVNNTEKQNPYGNNSYWDSTIPQGVMAVTLAGKVQYYNAGSRQGGGVGSKGSARSTGTAIGAGKRGTLQLKKLKEIADEIYVMDFESFRGGTKALKGKRAELKLGKDTFKDAMAWKRANLSRYKDIMQARVGGRDQVDAMVAKIVKEANEIVAAAMVIPKMGRYDKLLATVNDKEVELENVTRAMTKALAYYGSYIQLANEFDRDQEEETPRYQSDHSKNRRNEKAGEIKAILTKFKTGKLDGWY